MSPGRWSVRKAGGMPANSRGVELCGRSGYNMQTMSKPRRTWADLADADDIDWKAKFAALRKKWGGDDVSAPQCAARLGVTPRSWNYWASGDLTPSLPVR